jgi:hypothetical protein
MKIVDVENDDPEKQGEPSKRMARTIVEIIKETGACLPQDLNARGFTPDEVAKLWGMSKALAAQMMEL